METQNKLILISGMWVKRNSKGEIHLVGNMGMTGKLIMFKNGNKKSDSHPDYYLYITAKEEQPKKTDNSLDDDNPFEGL